MLMMLLFLLTYSRARLLVNAKKTEVLPLVHNSDSSTHTFSVYGDVLQQVHEFRYLGSILRNDCSLGQRS